MMDARAILDMYSHPDVTQFFNMPVLAEVDQAKKVIESCKKRFESGTGIRWAIARKEDNRVIGSVGYSHWIREWKKAEIGYEVNREFWNQGVATEALAEILRYGFVRLGLNRVDAMTVPENAASQRVLEKLGFQREGLLRQFTFWKGDFHDVIVNSLLKVEFMRT